MSYPTDSGLLAKTIRQIAATGKRNHAAGGATRTTVRDRSRAAGKRAHAIGAKLQSRSAAGRDEALAAVRRPVEFGHEAQLAECDAGVIVDHNVERGNPADAPQLAPAVDRVRTCAGRPPHTVTADRGYGEKAVEDDLHDLGVRHVNIPRKGKPSGGQRAEEHRPAFQRTIKWRNGAEGRISALTRGYGWDRTRIDGTEGAQIWIIQRVLAHNLVKISTLAA